MNFNFAGAEGAHDIEILSGGLSAINKSLNDHHDQTQAQIAQVEQQWRAGMVSHFLAATVWLESMAPFIENGETFAGLSPDERRIAVGRLLTTFGEQRRVVTEFHADHPEETAVRFISLLDHLIGTLEQQEYTAKSAMILTNMHIPSLPRATRERAQKVQRFVG